VSGSCPSGSDSRVEAAYTDAPQPYGELFVMRYDGTRVQQLTDNQWEDGTPAWQPTATRRPAGR
jgi:Tol biopolymer transport system component